MPPEYKYHLVMCLVPLLVPPLFDQPSIPMAQRIVVHLLHRRPWVTVCHVHSEMPMYRCSVVNHEEWVVPFLGCCTPLLLSHFVDPDPAHPAHILQRLEHMLSEAFDIRCLVQARLSLQARELVP